jgi:hypothetical protein
VLCAPLCTGLMLMPLATGPIAAQTGRTEFASLKATVTDSLSGKPLLRIGIWNIRRLGPQNSGMRFANSDTSGVVRLDSLPAGVEQFFQVMCDQGRLRSKQLDSLFVVLAAGELRHWIVRTSGAGCDQRPFTVRSGVFEGRWRVGFEESRFVPCDSVLPSAWMEFAPGAQKAPDVRWPKNLDKYYPEVFVRVEGQLVGPWRYGHMGVSDYQLTVNRTLTVRRPSKTRCGR